ncbi:MAG: DNA-binding transcriptional regulator [Thermoguttaceae bacterium]
MIETSSFYGRCLLQGIATYANERGPWKFYHHGYLTDDKFARRLRPWRPDGIIARIVSPQVSRQIRALGLPTVDLLHETSHVQMPQVIPDQPAIVRLAVDHLWECGLRQLAYAGFRGVRFSDQRSRCFCDYTKQREYPASVFTEGGYSNPSELVRVEELPYRFSVELADWLCALPKPIGLIACNDTRASQVLRVCSERAIRVPDEIAVIGVDNDPVVCGLAEPRLSTVDPNARRIGYQAAALLHQMIQGEVPAPRIVQVEPVGVVARRSTDVLAISNADVVEAIRFVREQACEGLTIAAIIERLCISRRTLERWFTQYVGHSPPEEINRVRLARVRELLCETNLPLEEIARSAGFSHVESMYRLFKDATGQTPGQYRQSQFASKTARRSWLAE